MDFRLDYPRSIEDWWINLTLEQLSCNSLQNREAQLERSIQTLSDGFTKERAALSKDYFADSELLCAYGLFFFPQNYARTSLVLQETISRGWHAKAPLTILDLGAGTGAASLSAASILNEIPVSLTAIDRSRAALSTMQKLASDCSILWPSLRCEFEEADIWQWSKRQNKKWDLIIASFSLNEAELMGDVLVSLLSEQGMIVVIEPALKSASEKLEAWRDQISRRSDLHIWGPCLHSSSCPLLQEGQFWCHEVRAWKPPESLRFLNRHLFRQIHVLKFSFLVFGRQMPAVTRPDSFRLISPVSKRKKSLVFTGCTNEGKKKDFRIFHTLTEDERKQVKRWERGDIVTLRFA